MYAIRSYYDKVVAFDNLSNSYAKNTKYGKFERGDIRDSKRIEEIILKYKPIAIIHLAASTSVGESTINPYEYYSNNVYGVITSYSIHYTKLYD